MPLPLTHFRGTFRFIGTLFIAMALFSLSGGHWAVLQTVAWSQMIQSYSSQGSFQSAIQKTFSGKYRCSLCKKIEQAKRQEKKNSFVNAVFKKRQGILERPFLLPNFFPKKFRYALLNRKYGIVRTIEPLTPPPRSGSLV